MIQGAWHSHIGWLFNSNWSPKEREKYVPDLMQDKLLVSIDKNYYLWVTATLAIPLVLGGVIGLFEAFTIASFAKGAALGFIWGGLARVCLSHHMTWSINSICHIIGSRDYKSGDDSRNNLFFGILSHGEGWHNNHHHDQRAASHGHLPSEFDMSWWVIRGLEMVGIAKNVVRPRVWKK